MGNAFLPGICFVLCSMFVWWKCFPVMQSVVLLHKLLPCYLTHLLIWNDLFMYNEFLSKSSLWTAVLTPNNLTCSWASWRKRFSTNSVHKSNVELISHKGRFVYRIRNSIVNTCGLFLQVARIIFQVLRLPGNRSCASDNYLERWSTPEKETDRRTWQMGWLTSKWSLNASSAS